MTGFKQKVKEVTLTTNLTTCYKLSDNNKQSNTVHWLQKLPVDHSEMNSYEQTTFHTIKTYFENSSTRE